VTLLTPRLDGASQMDGTAVEQELFGERGLAGVGMADDREGAPGPNRVVDSGVDVHPTNLTVYRMANVIVAHFDS
jgi:hypothetical protein